MCIEMLLEQIAPISAACCLMRMGKFEIDEAVDVDAETAL
jgi:hypothetical protein